MTAAGATCLLAGALALPGTSSAASSPLTLTGEQPYYSYSSQSLDSWMNLAVNVASGDLLVQSNDLDVAGTGLDLAVSRFYNSQSGQTTDFGGFWTMGSGADVRLAYNTPASGDATLYGPSGYQVVLAPNGSGGFNDPDGLNATLVHNSDGTSTLTFFQTGEVYHFNTAGQLASDVDKHGNTVTYNYTSGHLSSITDTRKRTLTVTTNSAGQITQLSDSTGRTWKYCYNSSGDLTSYTDPDGATTYYAYTGTHLLSQITDPNGNQTQIAYGSNGEVSSVSRAPAASGGAAEVTKFSYNLSPSSPCASGTYGETTVTDPNGHATIYCYDSVGRVTLQQNPDGHAASQTWGYDDLPKTAASPDQASAGVNSTLSYNSVNALTGITKGTGASSQLSESISYSTTDSDAYKQYDPYQVTDTQGNTTTYGYDSTGDMTSVQNPLGASNTLKYNGQGELTSLTDANGHTTSYTYDSLGQLITITAPQPSFSGNTSIGYDGLSRITTVTDGIGNKRTYVYNGDDELTQIVFADGSKESYTFDCDGNMLTRTDTSAGGSTQTTTYTYDHLNRMVKASYPTGFTVSYGYDAGNNLTSFTDGGGTVTYGYDPANLLTSLIDETGTTKFGYNNDGERTSTTFPDGTVETTNYDPADRVTGVSTANSGGTVLSSDSYVYGTTSTGHPDELESTVTDNSGNKTAYSYNTAEEMTQALTTNSAGTTTDNYQYTYDPAGNHTSQTTMYNSGSSTTQTLAYNAADQICWSIVGSYPSTCSSPPSGATTFKYDADGNWLGASNQTVMTWNDQDQLTTEQDTPTSSVTKYSYLGTGQQDWVGQGATTFENSTLGISASVNGATTTYYTRDPDGTLIDSHQVGGTTYMNQNYIYDGDGNVIALDSNGSIHRTYKYGPAGGVSKDSGSGFDTAIRYHGAWNSADNEYHFGARFYDPILRAWTQPDPLAQPSNLSQSNDYVYVGNDPINETDVAGLYDVGSAAKSCLQGAAQSGIVSAGDPEEMAVGCGTGVLSDSLKQAGCDVCADAVDTVGNIADGKTLADTASSVVDDIGDDL